jgi:hypothetical protein
MANIEDPKDATVRVAAVAEPAVGGLQNCTFMIIPQSETGRSLKVHYTKNKPDGDHLRFVGKLTNVRQIEVTHCCCSHRKLVEPIVGDTFCGGITVKRCAHIQCSFQEECVECRNMPV